MRVLITIPHYFGPGPANSPNRSNRPEARRERVQALVAVITSLHQNFGQNAYGLDHEHRLAVRPGRRTRHSLDIVVCTAGGNHLLDDLRFVGNSFRHEATEVEPNLLGFECHKLLRDHRGTYDYYGYLEDDVVITDPSFFKKRQAFDRRFGSGALLMPHRFEVAQSGPVRKLYVDYRLAKRVTSAWQKIDDSSLLVLSYCDEWIGLERTSYPSSGCFFLNADQLEKWISSLHFLDGDVSYLSPLDSASILSVMKTFRVYKPALDQAWFLEVLHGSPRWIGGIDYTREVKIVT
jgi:hypothetical protein